MRTFLLEIQVTNKSAHNEKKTSCTNLFPHCGKRNNQLEGWRKWAMPSRINATSNCFGMFQMCFKCVPAAPRLFWDVSDMLRWAQGCLGPGSVLLNGWDLEKDLKDVHLVLAKAIIFIPTFAASFVMPSKKLPWSFKSKIKSGEGQTILWWVCKVWQRICSQTTQGCDILTNQPKLWYAHKPSKAVIYSQTKPRAARDRDIP